MATPSEDTLTTIIKEFLTESQINVQAFPIWTTPIGIRKPDLLIKNDKYYPLEAKIRKQDLIKDMIKVQNDYLKFATELKIGGAFLLKHPNPRNITLSKNATNLKNQLKRLTFQLILMFPQNDQRQFEKIKGRFSDLIPIIIETVYYKRIKTELDIPTAIEILRKATNYLDNALKDVEMNILMSSMGGMELFEDLFQINNIKPDLKSIRISISFFILIQLLFYRVVSKYRPDELESLEEIRTLKELNTKYFYKVKDLNYRAVFGIDIVGNLPEIAVPHINAIIITLKSLRPENIKSDLIGTIFHDLIPLDIRKRVAAYYTNIFATELLSKLVINHESDSVIDLACGSGGLLVSAYRWKKELITRNKIFQKNDHMRFLNNDLFGIDIMPFATSIASCNLALQSPQFFTNKVNIGLWDSIDLNPGDTIPEFATLKFLFRTATLDKWFSKKEERRTADLASEPTNSHSFTMQKCDVVIMNPPFTRHERLPIHYKSRLRIAFNSFYNNGICNDALGLHGFFILLGNKFLKRNGSIALVLPASILARKSFINLRKYLCENFCIKYLVYNTSRLNFSESTLWREILLILEKKNPVNNTYELIRLENFPESLREVNELAGNIKNKINSSKFEVSEILQNNLAEMDDWSPLVIFSKLFKKIYDEFKDNQLLTTISSKFDCLENDLRHFKTRSNLSCFIQNSNRLNSDQLKEEWITVSEEKRSLSIKHHTIDGASLNIPYSALRRALRTTSNINHIDLRQLL